MSNCRLTPSQIGFSKELLDVMSSNDRPENPGILIVGAGDTGRRFMLDCLFKQFSVQADSEYVSTPREAQSGAEPVGTNHYSCPVIDKATECMLSEILPDKILPLDSVQVRLSSQHSLTEGLIEIVRSVAQIGKGVIENHSRLTGIPIEYPKWRHCIDRIWNTLSRKQNGDDFQQFLQNAYNVISLVYDRCNALVTEMTNSTRGKTKHLEGEVKALELGKASLGIRSSDTQAHTTTKAHPGYRPHSAVDELKRLINLLNNVPQIRGKFPKYLMICAEHYPLEQTRDLFEALIDVQASCGKHITIVASGNFDLYPEWCSDGSMNTLRSLFSVVLPAPIPHPLDLTLAMKRELTPDVRIDTVINDWEHSREAQYGLFCGGKFKYANQLRGEGKSFLGESKSRKHIIRAFVEVLESFVDRHVDDQRIKESGDPRGYYKEVGRYIRMLFAYGFFEQLARKQFHMPLKQAFDWATQHQNNLTIGQDAYAMMWHLLRLMEKQPDTLGHQLLSIENDMIISFKAMELSLYSPRMLPTTNERSKVPVFDSLGICSEEKDN